VTSAVSELRFDHSALRDLALSGAALVRADSGSFNLKRQVMVPPRSPSRVLTMWWSDA